MWSYYLLLKKRVTIMEFSVIYSKAFKLFFLDVTCILHHIKLSIMFLKVFFVVLKLFFLAATLLSFNIRMDLDYVAINVAMYVQNPKGLDECIIIQLNIQLLLLYQCYRALRIARLLREFQALRCFRNLRNVT